MIPATYVGVRTYPTDSRYGRTRHTCPRCGITRQVNAGDPRRVCGSCADEIRDLGEEHLWTATPGGTAMDT